MNDELRWSKPPKDVDELKRRVIALLRHGWTQGENARDKAGNEVSFHSPHACCWSLYGAMWRACEISTTGNAIEEELSLRIYNKAFKRGAINTYDFNDRIAKSVDEVISLVEAA